MSVSALKYRQVTIIKSSGPLIREFGRERRRQFGTGSVQEAFSTLCDALPGFKGAIMRLQRSGMRLAIYRNRRNVEEDELSIYGAREVRIALVIASSRHTGLVQVTIGIVMVVVAMIVTGGIGGFVADGAWGFVGATGAFLALGGVVQMLSPQARGLRQSVAPENPSSYAFSSARNTTASGNPMPICYGKCRWGGAIILVSTYTGDRT